MTETKTFKGFVLDETGCVKGAYPQMQNAIEKIAKNENEYIMQVLDELKIDPDVLTKQKAEIERLFIENKQLKAINEKLKCCGNYFHNNKPSDKEFCWNCERQLNDGQPIIKDEWEIFE